MNKEKRLLRAVLMGLLLTNVWYGAAHADSGMDGDKGSDVLETGQLVDGNSTKTYTSGLGTAGTDATAAAGHGGNGGSGGAINVAQTANGTVNGAIHISAEGAAGGTGGKGGNAAHANAYGGSGGAGGDSYISMTVDQAGCTAGPVLSLTAIGGNGGNGGDSSAYGSNPNTDNNNYGGNGGAGGNAINKGFVIKHSDATVDVTHIVTKATGGNGGNRGATYEISSRSGAGGGAAAAYGLTSVDGGRASANSNMLEVTAYGGNGGAGSAQSLFIAGSPAPEVDSGGNGGSAKAYGLYLENGELNLDVGGVHINVRGGYGGAGGTGGEAGYNKAFAGGHGAMGGDAYGAAVEIYNGKSVVTANGISNEVYGGAGGEGGRGSAGELDKAIPAGTGGTGGAGGTAEARGLSAVDSDVMLSAGSISAIAHAGLGGNGGEGGAGRLDPGDVSAGGKGGNGGARGGAYAKAIFASGGITTVATDTIWSSARGGIGGTGGYFGSGRPLGDYGEHGTHSAEAKAYGIYAERQAVVNLHAKTTGGTINTDVGASDAETTEAHALYADDATVLFHDNALLNLSDSGYVTNTVLTTLKNATLGFGGTTANRIIEGGTLSLTGSNTFRFTTDLANNASDKFNFAKLDSSSSTADQYVTVGYDKSFDGSSMDSISGEAVVLTVADLNGQELNNFKGKTSTLDAPLTRFTATPTVEASGNDVKITKIEFANASGSNASETAMTVSDMHMALRNLWRVEGNNMMKRMGELRNDKDAAEGGVWARYYRGEMSADSAYGRSFDQDYTGFQGGIDKVQEYKGGKLYTGLAINHLDSNAGYNSGSGDLSSTGIGLYASWLGSKGHYLDVIARGSRFSNDFKIVDLSGNAAQGDYNTWAYGISAEYGYRQNLKAGWFIEPQAELSLGRVNSAGYTTSNGVRVEHDGASSAVTRLGVLGGKEFTVSGHPGNAYLKASVLHDFGGNGGARGYYGSNSMALQVGDLTGSWYEVGIGANLGLGKNSNLYFDALKTFGGDLRTDWQFNAGLRFSF